MPMLVRRRLLVKAGPFLSRTSRSTSAAVPLDSAPATRQQISTKGKYFAQAQHLFAVSSRYVSSLQYTEIGNHRARKESNSVFDACPHTRSGHREKGQMRKSLWSIPVLLLIAAIGAPPARADTYNPSFTCTGICVSLPTAPAVSFPAPTTITETWDTIVIPITLPAVDTPGDTYIWDNVFVSPTIIETDFIDVTQNFTDAVVFTITQTPNLNVPGDRGTLIFTPIATPEPPVGSLMLLGIGSVFVMRKRIGRRLPQAI